MAPGMHLVGLAASAALLVACAGSGSGGAPGGSGGAAGSAAGSSAGGASSGGSSYGGTSPGGSTSTGGSGAAAPDAGGGSGGVAAADSGVGGTGGAGAGGSGGAAGGGTGGVGAGGAGGNGGTPVCPDADHDGHTDKACGGDDCDDSDPNRFPGLAEYCDYVDNDCDGVVDNGITYGDYPIDQDGDTFGGSITISGCPYYPPAGYTYATKSGDCYDDNKDARPTQDGFFGVDRGDGSFDYNCDGNEESVFPISGGCTTTSNCSSGWNVSPPPCGQSGSYFDCHVSNGQCVRFNRSYKNFCR